LGGGNTVDISRKDFFFFDATKSPLARANTAEKATTFGKAQTMIESRSRCRAHLITPAAVGFAMAVCLLYTGCTAPQRTHQAAFDLGERTRQISNSDLEIRSELELIRQEAASLTEAAFPAIAPVARPSGADGGGQP